MLPQGNLTTERKTGTALPSPFRFQKYGQSGIEVSEIFARTAAAHRRHLRHPLDARQHAQPRAVDAADELRRRAAVAARAWGPGSPTAWGPRTQNLPGFIAMCPGLPVADVSNWRSAFLPGVYQGTYIDTRKEQGRGPDREHPQPGRDPGRPAPAARPARRAEPPCTSSPAPRTTTSRPGSPASSWPTACRWPPPTPSTSTRSRNPSATLYGPGVQARQLLIARRLIERGVRFVQLYHGDVQPWDSHDHIAENHRSLGQQCDQAIAALLTDLKQRGLFEETLVLCGGEFGRTPAVEMVNGKPGMGRDHNHWGFSVWLAGGGVKGGHVHGATDEFGYRAVEKPVHVHDLHATILHLLGFDHTRLTYRYAGRDFRLTDVQGEVVRDILA